MHTFVVCVRATGWSKNNLRYWSLAFTLSETGPFFLLLVTSAHARLADLWTSGSSPWEHWGYRQMLPHQLYLSSGRWISGLKLVQQAPLLISLGYLVFLSTHWDILYSCHIRAYTGISFNISVSLFLMVTVIKYPEKKKQLKKGFFFLTHSLRFQSSTVGSHGIGARDSCYITPVFREWRARAASTFVIRSLPPLYSSGSSCQGNCALHGE